MKFDDNMITILKNYVDINPSLLIENGNVLRTMSPAKSIVAKSMVPVVFPKRIAIYDLKKFIDSIQLFKEPDITFNDNHLVISKDNVSVNFTYSDEDLIIKPIDKELVLPSIDVEFDITEDQLKTFFKAINSLKLDKVFITGDGSNVYVQAGNNTSGPSMIYSIKMSETDKVFRFVFNVENLKIINQNYHVQISKSRISYFKSNMVEYYIAVSNESTFS